MDDGSKHNNNQKNDVLIDSSSYIICGRKDFDKRTKRPSDLVRCNPLGGNKDVSEVEVEVMNGQVCPMHPMSPVKKNVAATPVELQNSNSFRAYLEPYCQTKEPCCQRKLNALSNLKDSTRKLLHLIDDIQAKTYSKNLPLPNPDEIQPVPSTAESVIGSKISSFCDAAEQALKQLEAETKSLNNIYIQDEDDDCSIFKRLTRKCTCLNQEEYNDLMIHFNEDTKYVTTTIGEVIKNIRIVKKFLYMGGTYSKNALLFLNEGFEKSEYAERVEITQGCSHADLCNVFENPSLVTVCISWPQKYTNFVDNFTQNLAASFLYKLARLEEGRRYLKYTTKITNDIKRVLRKGGPKLDENIIQKLTAALNLIVPPMAKNVNITYCCRHNDEGKMKESVNALHQFRQYMTLEEVIMYLDLLTNFTQAGTAKTDFTTYLPDLFLLFKQMLKEYDNSEINIIITNILNNIVSNSKNNNNILKEKESDGIIAMKVADTATESVEMLNEIIQMPETPKGTKKTFNKFRQVSKFRQASRRKVSEFSEPAFLNRSKKFGKIGPSIIMVPVEKKTQLKKELILEPDHT